MSSALIEQMPAKRNDLDRVLAYVQKLAHASFWGEITICFKDGQIINIREEQTKVPINL